MSDNRKVFRVIAGCLEARVNCARMNNTAWGEAHERTIDNVIEAHLPHGSGFDNGVKLAFDLSSKAKLVFIAPFHHMNENGYYDGWEEYKVIVTPSLSSDFDLRITGKDKNQIKDYIADCFSSSLVELVEDAEFAKP